MPIDGPSYHLLAICLLVYTSIDRASLKRYKMTQMLALPRTQCSHRVLGYDDSSDLARSINHIDYIYLYISICTSKKSSQIYPRLEKYIDSRIRIMMIGPTKESNMSILSNHKLTFNIIIIVCRMCAYLMPLATTLE